MLKALRKNTKTLLWVAASIFILATFMGLGGYFFTRTSNVVAKVNGIKISYDTFNATYLQRLNGYRNMYNAEITDEMANNLKKVVLEEMIRKTLLMQEARKRKLKVSDAELNDYIQKFPYFQKDGRFNQQLYLGIIRNQLHTTPGELENDIRQSMMMAKLHDQVTAEVTAVPAKEIDEALAKYQKEKKPAGTKAMDPARERLAVTQELLQQKKEKVYEVWYNELKAKSRIEENLEKVEQEMQKYGTRG